MQSLSPPVRDFIERMGSLMERLGSAKTLGRLLGLLLVATRPLSLDELARLLMVSKASVSTNARICEQIGLVQRVSLPGDRRTYYEVRADSFGRLLEVRMSMMRDLEEIAEQGREAVDADNSAAKERLDEMRAFYAFATDEMAAMLRAWRNGATSKTSRQVTK